MCLLQSVSMEAAGASTSFPAARYPTARLLRLGARPTGGSPRGQAVEELAFRRRETPRTVGVDFAQQAHDLFTVQVVHPIDRDAFPPCRGEPVTHHASVFSASPTSPTTILPMPILIVWVMGRQSPVTKV